MDIIKEPYAKDSFGNGNSDLDMVMDIIKEPYGTVW